MFAQVDAEGNRHVLLDQIIDHRTDGTNIKLADSIITSSNGGQRRIETTKEWEILVQWKDGSSTWEALKDMKECYPVQLFEYALESRISDEPVFAWWLPHVIKKQKQIISKIKSKYWTRTHKFGIRVPKSIQDAIAIDKQNGNHLQWEAICDEMKNVLIAFEIFEGDVTSLPPNFCEVKYHMIFDVKMGENFRRKARMVTGGHTTNVPAVLA